MFILFWAYISVSYAALVGWPIFWTFIGLTLAPMGALVCGVLARRRGLSFLPYAGLGLLSSLLFLVPMVYLVQRLKGRTPPRYLVGPPCVVVYLVWVLQLAFMLFLSLRVEPIDAALAIVSLILALSTGLLIYSLLRFRGWRNGLVQPEEQEPPVRFTRELKALLATPLAHGWLANGALIGFWGLVG